MKKIAAFFSFLFLLSNVSFSQDFRFGFQLSPTFSWMSTDDNEINGNGANLGLKLGMLGEKFVGGGDTYAFLFGLGFAFNQGGTLLHDTGGNFWTKSDLKDDQLNTGPNPLPDGVNLKYNLQYVEIPLGLKMRTQEFGYLRYFAEIPVFTLGINTQARGSISGMGVSTENENIKKDVNFLNISWGLGGGIEYTVSSSTALIGGIFFQSGFLDVTDDGGSKYQGAGSSESENSKGTINSITIRLGVMF